MIISRGFDLITDPLPFVKSIESFFVSLSMLIKFGSIVTEGSGSLGGHTIQHSKGGMQLRTKPLPGGTPSASQILIRSINLQLQAGWRQLTDSQRKIWNDWPVTHGIFNAKGDKHPLSGHSLWMKYQYGRLFVQLSFLSHPSLYLTNYFGPELVINGDFISSSGWNFYGTAFTISDGKLNAVNALSSDFIYRYCNPVIGNKYRFKVLVDSIAFGSFVFVCKSPYWIVSKPGLQFKDMTSTPSDPNVYVQGYSLFTGIIDYISIKEIYNY